MESCVWKEFMARIMNEEYDWDHNVEVDAVEGPVVCFRKVLEWALRKNGIADVLVRSVIGLYQGANT